MSGRKIIKNLTKKGNCVIGVGCYSAVLASGNDKVIKVGTDMGDPWLDYYHLIVKTIKNNIYLPRIESFYASDSYYVARVEKLQEVTAGSDAEKVTNLLKKYIDCYIETDELIDSLYEVSHVVPDIKSFVLLADEIKKYTVFNSEGMTSEGDCWQDLWDEGFEDRKLDLHNGNVMLRDGVLVITDPWANVNMEDVEDLTCWAGDHLGW